MTDTNSILKQLIAFPTVSRDSNMALITYVAELLAQYGITADIISNADATKANLYASTGPGRHGGVMLSGHTDVVPIDGQNWTVEPFIMSDMNDRFYGRGTTDMKGFVAASISSMIAASQMDLAEPLHLALSYDEELGCLGVPSLLQMMAATDIRPAMCIVGEPTEMKLAVGHKGKTAITAECCGREAHSALAPTAVNALHLACDLVNEIRSLQADIAKHGIRDDDFNIPYTTLHAGIMSGGVQVNIVPNKATVHFEIRNIAEDDPMAILDDLKHRLQPVIAAARDIAPDADIDLTVTNSYPGLNTPKQADIVSFMNTLTGNNATIKVAFGTEGGLFSRDLGIPTIVCGPGSMDQGHKPDEYISKAQLAACDNMLAALNQRLTDGTISKPLSVGG
ncbi:MAG: acetylornithine deacetylase [Candidatus Puniceispirillales bacterium]